MRRRRFLRVAGLALTAALAGCRDDVDNDRKRTPPGPETADSTAAVQRPIRALWTAYNDEDAAAVVETLHPDSPTNITTDTIQFRGTVAIESITVTDRSADTATAEATVTVTDGSRTVTEHHDYELRTHEGAWRVWTFTTDGAATATPTA